MDAWHSMGDWGWAMMAFWIVLWLALIGLAVWAVSEWTGRRGQPREPGESPRDILDRRLAQGEISLEEYERARDALVRPREAAPR
jgi:putative membrane protein